MPKTRKQVFLDDCRQLLTAPEDTVALIEKLSDLDLPPRVFTHFALLTRRGDVAKRLSAPRMSFATVSDLSTGTWGSVLQLSFQHEDLEGESGTVVVRLTPIPNSPFMLLLTLATAKQWRLGVQRFIDWLYPVLYRPFLRQPDLYTIFERLRQKLLPQFSIRITRLSSARRLLTSTGASRPYQSEMLWTDLDPAQAFADASEGLVYFRSISFEVRERHADTNRTIGTGVTGTITRDAHFSSNSDAGWMYRAGVETALERALKDKELSTNRGRGEKPAAAAPSLAAQFSSGISLEREDLPRIAASLRSMPRTAVSILHGNPYLHATVVDMLDGSSFDVMILSKNRMLIVPQLRATENAVTRLCRFIYDEIGECEFYDAQSAPELLAADDA